MNATSVFQNSAIAYAASNLRDSYYLEMARFVFNAVKARMNGLPGMIVELGCGIGMSTMEILKDLTADSFLIAIEPEEEMRHLCRLNTMGDPRVKIVEGRGENFARHFCTLPVPMVVDAVICCQVFHLFNPPGGQSSIPLVLQQIMAVLKKNGVFAFDLGPSSFEFAIQLADHRSGIAKRGEIITELAHPLYQRAHEITLNIVRREFPKFNRKELWPPVAARMSFEFLSDACRQAGLKDLKVSEDLLPMSGERVVNLIRSGWMVFFRWPPLSELPTEKKLELMNEALNCLFREPDFARLRSVMSYHPTAVFTAVKY